MTGLGNYLAQAYARMNLPQIRSFILTGETEKTQHGANYEERLDEASEPVYDRINRLYPSAREATEPTNELSHALSTFQEVYFEIGMKAGARLLYQLMMEDEKQPAKPTE